MASETQRFLNRAVCWILVVGLCVGLSVASYTLYKDVYFIRIAVPAVGVVTELKPISSTRKQLTIRFPTQEGTSIDLVKSYRQSTQGLPVVGESVNVLYMKSDPRHAMQYAPERFWLGHALDYAVCICGLVVAAVGLRRSRRP